MTDTSILSTARLGAGYQESERSIQLFSDIHLSVVPNQLWALTGRSGSGKTTLLKILAGLQNPQEGETYWRQKSVNQMSSEQRVHARQGFIGVAEQEPFLIPGLTVLENVLIAAGAQRRKQRRLYSRAMDLLTVVGLEKRARANIDGLSGGERQRIGLIRALVTSAELIIVDEPTASLDHDSATTVIELLREHTQQGASVLAATHDANLVAQATDVLDLDANIS